MKGIFQFYVVDDRLMGSGWTLVICIWDVGRWCGWSVVVGGCRYLQGASFNSNCFIMKSIYLCTAALSTWCSEYVLMSRIDDEGSRGAGSGLWS